MTYCNEDDGCWNAVSMLLPEGRATLVDVEVFERLGSLEWRVMGTSIYHMRRYTVVVNPTAWVQNRRHGVRYRMESLPRLVVNAPKGKMVDHINRNRWDNRIQNLRLATGTQNAMNRPGQTGKTSRYKGVHWSKKEKKWMARATLEGNQYWLGRFVTEIEAAMAYNEFIKKHSPEFGFLNEIVAAHASDEPTSVRKAPQLKKGRLKKKTEEERRLRKEELWREKWEREKKEWQEKIAARKPWEPGDPTWPPAFTMSKPRRRMKKEGPHSYYWREEDSCSA